MTQYQELLKDILKNGTPSDDRTGTGTLSVFGRHLSFDLQKGFPIVTCKKTWYKGVLLELLWILQGSTNIRFLQKHKVGIWDAWADVKGNLGPVYGKQLRDFNGIDQLYDIVNKIKLDPNSRRIVYSLWNVSDLEDMALMPCHGLTVQFYVRDGKLSASVYQRSCDVFLGLPFNLASYATMIHMLARECELRVGRMEYFLGDCHIYTNLIEQSKTLVDLPTFDLPYLHIDRNFDLFELLDSCDDMSWDEISDQIKLIGYESGPTIKGKVSV